ncbi:MAG: SDR family oxidoreductase [Methylophaga sp.]|nr:SDR family oxidoreductase [Methylophaga sp.]
MNNTANVIVDRYSESIHESLNILVVGATGGTGRATVEKLLNEGHNVTAFSRSANELINMSDQIITINGDVTNTTELDQVVKGQDVIIVTLGISENPMRVRICGAVRTPSNVRSIGTRNVITAMRKHGVPRLVVQSSYGVGETRGLLRFVDQLFFNLILKPQIDDTERQEIEIRQSGVDWVIVQPVHLTDNDSNSFPFISTTGQTRLMKVARKSVAKFLALAAHESDYIGKSVAISG